MNALTATAPTSGGALLEKMRSGEIEVATKRSPMRAAPPLEVARKKLSKAAGTIHAVLSLTSFCRAQLKRDLVTAGEERRCLLFTACQQQIPLKWALLARVHFTSSARQMQLSGVTLLIWEPFTGRSA